MFCKHGTVAQLKKERSIRIKEFHPSVLGNELIPTLCLAMKLQFRVAHLSFKSTAALGIVCSCFLS